MLFLAFFNSGGVGGWGYDGGKDFKVIKVDKVVKGGGDGVGDGAGGGRGSGVLTFEKLKIV